MSQHPQQGGDGDLGRWGMQEAPFKPHTVTALGLSRERAQELKAGVMAGGWEAGAAQQSKTCGEALQGVRREVKSFNWSKAG